MPFSSYGHVFRITTFGESHGPGIGVVVDGVPSGLELTEADVQKELDRRRPGQSLLTTQRKEEDKVEILSGVFEGLTTGAPLAMLIRNHDADSSKYEKIKHLFRPAHADYTYHVKYHHRDWRGGGRSSGRETACRVAAGAVAKKLLASRGMRVVAATVKVKDVVARQWIEEEIERNPARCPDPEVAAAMATRITEARSQGDSVGGVIEGRVTGVPPGLGEPIYDKLDAMIAHGLFSIGTVRGVEFGNGFACTDLHGSENNDPMGKGGFLSNRCGGILGGLSNGMPIVFRAAIKSTASIAKWQKTMDVEGQPADIRVEGRHDPCICPRAVPVVEAMAALTLMDALLMSPVQEFMPKSGA